MEKQQTKVVLGITLGVAVAALIYWITRPIKKPRRVQVEVDKSEIQKSQEDQVQDINKQKQETVSNAPEEVPLPKQNLLHILELAKDKLANKMMIIKPKWKDERKKCHKKDDAHYRKIVKEFSQTQQASVDEAIREALAEFGFEIMQFRIWLSMYNSSAQVKKALESLTDALILAKTPFPEYVTKTQIEQLLDYQVKRMEELCKQEPSFNNDSIAYISCYISDEMQEIFSLTEEEINAAQAFYKKNNPTEYQIYFEKMQKSASQTVKR